MNKLIKQAFTLIELLVVIAIIGILSGMIVVSMSGVTQKANIAKSQVFANSVRNLLMINTVVQYSFDDITDYVLSTKVVNSNAGNVPDSWADNEARAIGGPILKEGSECVFGNCLSFDGSNDYVDFGNTGTASTLLAGDIGFADGDDFTLILWYKGLDIGTGSGLGQTLIGRDNGDIYANLVLDDGYFQYNHYNGTWLVDLKSISRVTDGNWHFLVYVNHSNKTGDVYIDTTKQVSGRASNITAGRYFKADLLMRGYTGEYTSGLIDEVKIYNAALPSSEIKEQYYARLNKMLNNGNISREEYLSRINSIANE
ncbi:MAG: LamG-like jellyroll fold domain-containing protein [Candidatus Paceibacterota bacterium]|jgi:prepilin-type N-terminal cleavage/methylation domain-containing protein